MLEAIRKAFTLTGIEPETDHGVQPDERGAVTCACFAPLLEVCHSGLFIYAPESGFLYANSMLVDMLGYRPGDMVGLRWRDLIVPEGDGPVDESLFDGQWGPGEVCERGLRLAVRDGSGTRKVVMRCRQFAHDGKAMLAGSVMDVTDLRRGETALRDYARRLQLLSRQIIEVQENERCNLARELHDEIGQQLTLLKLSLEALRQDNAGALLDDALEGVGRLMQQVRDLSLDLRPSMLDDLGLVAALRWYLGRAAKLAEIAATFEVGDGFPRMPSQVETLFFRVGQEAITNVLRHSAAIRVSVSLEWRPNSAVMTITDNGRGFEPSSAQSCAISGRRAGLLGMQERAALAGATLEIESAPGAGTKLRLAIAAQQAGIGNKSG